MVRFINWLLGQFIEKTYLSIVLYKFMTHILPAPIVRVRGVPIKIVIPFHQIGVFRTVKSWETRESETLDWIDAFEPGCVFVDIGASFGNETLYAALKQNGPHEIVCFDLSLQTSYNLAFNLNLNSITKVRQYYLAVADCAEFVNTAEYTNYLGVPGRPELEMISYRTWGMSLDEFVERTGHQPDYIKIDVDGFEDRVVKGMYQTLRSPQLKSLLIEVNAIARAAVLQGLADAGFVESGRVALGAEAENIIFRRMTPQPVP
jgi:FkbM family methyltransferase